MKRTELLAVSLVTIALVAGGVYVLLARVPMDPCAGATGVTRTFAVVAGRNGFNDSASGPVLTVDRCDKVIITYINSDNQPHGFAVDSYATKGVALAGGQSQSISFTAYKMGQFRIFCNIFCTVHPLMQSGQLNVT
ncbi:MAG TPA: hypothetical protein VFE98_05865 [Candidatus Bathyarchaeia archaeon]|nr:hypothetical protein [Candidatus Bathyarchaeia archaeon]